MQYPHAVYGNLIWITAIVFLVSIVIINVSNLHFIIKDFPLDKNVAGLKKSYSNLETRVNLNSSQKHENQVAVKLCPGVLVKSKYAIVTYLGLNNAVQSKIYFYIISACKLAQSILKFTSELDLIMLLATEDGWTLDSPRLNMIEGAGWQICSVNFIGAKEPIGNRFHDAKIYTKLYVWQLEEYEAVASVDADVLALGNVSDLFYTEWPSMQQKGYSFAMALDYPRPGHQPGLFHTMIGRCTEPQKHWSSHTVNQFNAGIFLLRPSSKIYDSLINMINDHTSYDIVMCEQGLLNAYFFNKTYTLPFKYNGNVVAKACLPEFYNEQRPGIIFLHFTVAKPWMSSLLSSEWMWSCPWWLLDEECSLWKSTST